MTRDYNTYGEKDAESRLDTHNRRCETHDYSPSHHRSFTDTYTPVNIMSLMSIKVQHSVRLYQALQHWVLDKSLFSSVMLHPTPPVPLRYSQECHLYMDIPGLSITTPCPVLGIYSWASQFSERALQQVCSSRPSR